LCGEGIHTHEEVVCCRTETTHGKELHKIEKLAMNVTADLEWVQVEIFQEKVHNVRYRYRRVNVLDVGFLDKDFASLQA
jgi:hypothetical protein